MLTAVIQIKYLIIFEQHCLRQIQGLLIYESTRDSVIYAVHISISKAQQSCTFCREHWVVESIVGIGDTELLLSLHKAWDVSLFRMFFFFFVLVRSWTHWFIFTSWSKQTKLFSSARHYFSQTISKGTIFHSFCFVSSCQWHLHFMHGWGHSFTCGSP